MVDKPAGDSEAFRMADGSLAPSLLLAMPQLRDPNFSRAVVLLCEHGPDGAVGFVVNRPTDIRAANAVALDPPPQRDSGLRLWTGGPVETNRGFLLLGNDPGSDGSQRSPPCDRSRPRPVKSGHRWAFKRAFALRSGLCFDGMPCLILTNQPCLGKSLHPWSFCRFRRGFPTSLGVLSYWRRESLGTLPVQGRISGRSSQNQRATH